MKIVFFECDKCGARVQSEERPQDWEFVNVTSITKSIYLCPGCVAQLKKWLKNG